MENSQGSVVEGPQFTAGGVLSRTLDILKKNIAVFFVLSAVAIFPPLIIMALVPPSMGAIAISSIVSMILALTVQGAMAYAVYRSLCGDTASLGESVQRGMARFIPLFLAALLSGLGIGIGSMLLLIPGIILTCMWAVVIPACVVEGLGPVQSLSRSAELTKGYRMTIFGLALVYYLLVFGINYLLVVVVEDMTVTAATPLIINLVNGFLLLVPETIYLVMLVVIYYMLRVAKEGVGVDKLANVFD